MSKAKLHAIRRQAKWDPSCFLTFAQAGTWTKRSSQVSAPLLEDSHRDANTIAEEERLVVIRFGRDADSDCMRQDEVLYKISELVRSESLAFPAREELLLSSSPDFAVIYVCDIDEVPDFNTMYELYDPMTIMFFFRNKHMMCDFGTGNNNKLNWVLEDKQELLDIIETIYKGAKKGRGLVVSPKDYSTRHRY